MSLRSGLTVGPPDGGASCSTVSCSRPSVLTRCVRGISCAARLRRRPNVVCTGFMCIGLKDIDFSRSEIVVRDGKGGKDRVTMLPTAVKEPLQRHLDWVRKQYQDDLRSGSRGVTLPYALERKYPNGAREWAGSGCSLPPVTTLTEPMGRSGGTTCTSRFYKKP